MAVDDEYNDDGDGDDDDDDGSILIKLIKCSSGHALHERGSQYKFLMPIKVSSTIRGP